MGTAPPGPCWTACAEDAQWRAEDAQWRAEDAQWRAEDAQWRAGAGVELERKNGV